MASNETNSQAVNSQELSLTQGITDVYIGVFFDGTANNMLWTAKEKIKKYRDKLNKKKLNNFSEDDKKYIKNLSKDDVDIIINLHKNEYNCYLKDNSKNDEINSKKDFFKHKKFTKIDIETAIADKIVDNHTTLDESEWADFVKLQLSKEDKCRALRKWSYHSNCKDCKLKSHECNLLNETDAINNWIINKYRDNKYFWGKDAIRQFKNAHTIYKPTMCGGFSNIAILYSAYNPTPHETESKKYNIYIEGSGATDISEKEFLVPELLEKMNTNGLGFGLGKTGVVALVSKAVYYVNNYIESIKSTFNKSDKVNIHFNVFGFSRGAACSRLFSYLVTRGVGESLGKREKEFADFYAKNLYFKLDEKKDAKLHFLEDPNYNKTVDFLGIYDTVVSIGFLLQKDGFVHRLASGYKITGLHADNYIANWHCNNVSEYGMYSTSSGYTHKDKIKNILHICAMDEYRENFALTNVGKTVGNNAVEIYIPGCHSDVGGGYYDGDEEQEILLQKKIKRGDDLKEDEWNERRKSNEVGNRKSGSKEKYQYIGKKQVDGEDDKKLQKSLIGLGWIDDKWDDESYCAKIALNGANVPCTIRVVNGPNNLKFKRNVKAGYSNIPLDMMMTYAENIMKSGVPVPGFPFKKLFGIEHIKREYPIPYDLNEMSEAIKRITLEKAKRYWIYPKDDDYKELRMKYLHFTSTYRTLHINNVFSKNAKLFEGSPGNIANTPNQDVNGRICRIVYNGDEGDYNINYMYNDVKKEDIIISPCSVDFVFRIIGDFPPKNPSIC